MYQALLSAGGSLQTYPSAAFNVGGGDFTVLAMIESTSGGTLVARKGTAGGAGNGGFLLVVNPDGSIKFATDDGFGCYQIVTRPTSVLGGEQHTVAGIRSGATLTVLLDGSTVPATSSGNGGSPLNIDNNLPLTIGCTQQGPEPHNQFLGAVTNVSFWSAALSGDQFVSAAFGRLTGSEPNLQGYWSLDATGDDLSPNDNPASIVGSVQFRYCFGCVWAEAANAYTFCQITNLPDSRAPTTTVSLAREIAVPAGAPALAYAIMADQDRPTFPAGAQVQLTDPTGLVYNQDQNTETVFATTAGGQLWGLMVINPAPGTWQVTVTAPASSAFHLTLHTVPSADVVATCRSALDPLFGAGTSAQVQFAQSTFGSFRDLVAGAAVAAVVGVIVAGAPSIVGLAVAPAALAVGVAAFALISIALILRALPRIADSRDDIHPPTLEVEGMSGFVVAKAKWLMMDANVDAVTKLVYDARKATLYPAVTASPFNKAQVGRLVGNQMTLNKVHEKMSSFNCGYVSASGHGETTHLAGWLAGEDPDSAGDDPDRLLLQQVVATQGVARFTDAMVRNKIIHFFACFCGYLGHPSGLGQAMVAYGAVAFFGYKGKFMISVDYPAQFCAPDIEIDLQMLRGKTCAEASTAAIVKFNEMIKWLRSRGHTEAASVLEFNRQLFVSPSSNPAYGKANARLEI
jgi:hypothetical protein